MTTRQGIRYRWVWAKSLDAQGRHLPLEQHLRDAAAAAGHLWDTWVAESVKRSLVDTTGLSSDQVRQIYVFLTGVHDVGKASPAFVVMDQVLAARCRQEHGLPISRSAAAKHEDRCHHHSRIGQIALMDWLQRTAGIRRGIGMSWGLVIGSHHGDHPSRQALLETRRHDALTGAGTVWEEIRDELIAEHVESTGVAALGWPKLPQAAQVLLTALVIMADWIASNEELFPYEISGQADRLETAMQRLQLPAQWHPVQVADAVRLYRERFGFDPRPMQVDVAQAAAQMTEPGLMIVEAPMGEGKTEAALVAAEILAGRFGAGGVHIGLPTQATADAMFSRILDWTDSLPETELSMDTSIWLGHGKARLNRDFETLLGQTRDIDAGEPVHRVGRHSWFGRAKTSELSSICVSTVDHLLMGALRSSHVVLRHLGMVGKVVVIDEVHAYDVWMSGYLERLLSWLGAYKVPVVLLSATLPPQRRAALASVYDDGIDADQVAAHTGYPLTTVVASGRVHQRTSELSTRQSTVTIEFAGREVESVEDQICSAVDAGACVLVVQNTVRRAITTYEQLSQRLGEGRLTLAHSRFLAADRAENDRLLLDMFGSPSRLAANDLVRPDGHVVIATQVAEQSLDVDFDMLVTDVAPVDLVLQRLGRVHRHERPRPAGFEQARMIVIGAEIDPDGSICLDRSAKPVYGDWARLRAVDVLQGYPVCRLPQDIAPMVRQAYEGHTTNPHWVDAEIDALEQARLLAQQKAAGSRAFQLDAPGLSDGITDFIAGRADHRDGDCGRGVGSEVDLAARQVRDGQDTLEVVVVTRNEFGELTIPDWVDTEEAGVVLPTDRPLSAEAVRTLGSCTVRVPSWSPRWVDRLVKCLDEHTPPAWEESRPSPPPAVLVLDRELRAEASPEISYDPITGLTIDY